MDVGSIVFGVLVNIYLVVGDGFLYLQFEHFSNPYGTDYNGHCCDGRWNLCEPNGCDHKFTICLDDVRVRSHCKYGKLKSRKITNQNEIRFGGRVGKLKNPMKFKVNGRVPVEVKLKVVIFDHDTLFSDDFVDYLKENIIVSDNFTVAHTQYLIDRTKLTIRMWRRCSPNWYGDDCATYCNVTENEEYFVCNPRGSKECQKGYTGVNCKHLIRDYSDCLQLSNSNHIRRSGVHPILISGIPSKAFCKDGWTLIQRRSGKEVDFNRTWEEYKQGFGDVNGDYWMGLDMIHLLTNQQRHSLRIELDSFPDETMDATYAEFSVDGEADNYTLHIDGYVGQAGNALQYDEMNGRRLHDGMAFSTPDRDNDRYPDGNCAQLFQSGWWFNRCYWANLNGVFREWTDKHGPPYCTDGQCIAWKSSVGHRDISFRKTAMWIKPNLLD